MAHIDQRSDPRFLEKVKNFPTNLYRVDDRNSHIFKLLYTLLEIGVGQIKGLQDMANQSQSSLAMTEGSDLDQFYQLFGIQRNGQFFYDGNLFSDGSIDTFTEFKSLDAKFRIAISKMLQAFQKGGTLDGLRLLAEASSSYPVQILENWKGPNELARFDDAPNEVIVLIKPNKNLTEIESNTLRTKVIRDLEMIRPSNALLTVVIDDPEDEYIVTDYAAAGSFSFFADNNKHYFELLSQEKEIDINAFVVDATAFTLDSTYQTILGQLIPNGDLENSIVVAEVLNFSAPVFFALISDGVEEEIIHVQNRTSFEENGQTLTAYEVSRGLMGTNIKDWNNSLSTVLIKVDFMELNAASSIIEGSLGSWINIPDADSPDNYPAGKFQGDPTRYDANGNYLFEWSNQSEFREWFQKQIEMMGGEINNNKYRIPSNLSTIVSNQDLLASLAASYPMLRPIVRPDNNE